MKTINTDHDLLERLKTLTTHQNQQTAELLRLLVEIEKRKLYLQHACSSLFTYLVERLNYPEPAAGKRIWVSRICEKFPILFDMVARGDIHLAGIQVLATHLTQENHVELLERAKGKSKRAIEQIALELSPKPNRPTIFRTLPVFTTEPPPVSKVSSLTENPVVALSPTSYLVEVVISDAARNTLQQLRNLLPHSDTAEIVSRALEELLKKTLKRKAAITKFARKAAKGKRTRTIPAGVRREVWERDQGRCAFVDEMGNRCSEQRYIEFHHIDPFARGGEHSPGNVSLLCRAHNQFQAELDYGKGFMESKRRPFPFMGGTS